jgi:hypothetical protein
MAITISNNGTLKVLQELKCKYTAGPLTIDYNGLVGGGYIQNLRVRDNSESVSFSYNNVEIQEDFKMERDGDVYIIKNTQPFIGTGKASILFEQMEDVYIISNTFMNQLMFRIAENVTISSNDFYDTVQFKDCDTAGTIQRFINNNIYGGVADVGFRSKHNNYLIVDNNYIENADKQGIEFRVDTEAERGGPAEFTNNTIFSCGMAGIRTKDVTITFNGNTIDKCGTQGTSTDEEYSGAMMEDVHYQGFSNNILKNNKGAGLVTKHCTGSIGGPPGRENIIFNNGSETLPDGQGGNAGISIKDIEIGGLTIAGNIVYSNWSDGIGIKDTTNLLTIGAVSRNNKIYRNRRHGIALQPAAAVSVIPVIEYNEIHSNWRNGIGIRQYGKVIIRDNEIYSNNEIGISFVSDGWATIVERNLIHHNQDSGIGFLRDAGNTSDEFLFKNNIIYSNSLGGIKLEKFKGTLQLYFNTIADNTDYGIYREGNNNPMDNIYVYNTILWGHPDDIEQSALNIGAFENNDTEEGYQSGSNGNISSDPQFVALNGIPYHIQDGSPCENAGASTTPDVDDDYDNGTRPYTGGYDMGADEEGSTAPVDTVIVSSLSDSNQNVTQGAQDQGTLRFRLETNTNTANLSKVQIVPTANCTASYPDDYYSVRLYRDRGPSAVDDNLYEFDAYGNGSWLTPDSVSGKCSEDASYKANATRDDDTGTQWKTITSDTTSPHYIEYDMKQQKIFTKVRVFSGLNVRSYDVYVSTDNTYDESEKVVTGWQVGGASQWYESPSFNQDGRYIRLEISGTSTGDGEYDSADDTFLANFYYDENNQIFSAGGIVDTIDTTGAEYLVVVNIAPDADVNDVIEFKISDTDNGIEVISPDVVDTPYTATSAQYTITPALNWYTGCSGPPDQLYLNAASNFPDGNKTLDCDFNSGNRDDNTLPHWIRYRIGSVDQNKTVDKIRIYAKPGNPAEPRIVNIYLHQTSGQTGTVDATLYIGTAEGYYTSGTITETDVNYITIESEDQDLPQKMIIEMEYGSTN